MSSAPSRSRSPTRSSAGNSARTWCTRSSSRTATRVAPAPRRRITPEMSGTTKKFKKQKGGGARHGDYRARSSSAAASRSPLEPRSFAQKVNRKMYRGALRFDPVGAESPGASEGRRVLRHRAAQDQGSGRASSTSSRHRPHRLIVTRTAREPVPGRAQHPVRARRRRQRP